MFKTLISLLRIKHYIKNLSIFVPFLFSLHIVTLQKSLTVFIAFIAFCMLSSAIYIINDIFDIKIDKLHPIKKERSIASGKISIKSAISIFFILTFISLLLFINIDIWCTLASLTYLLLNFLYSLYLKHIAYVDISCISIGFTLRILVGYFALSTTPSIFLILAFFFLSFFFTLIKRKLESETNFARIFLDKPNSNELNTLIYINAILSIIFYATHVFLLKYDELQITNSFYIDATIVPFSCYIIRFFLLNSTKNNRVLNLYDYPYKDRVLISLLFLYIALFLMDIFQ